MASAPSAGADADAAAGTGEGLSAQDRAMVDLYMAGCFHYWDQLPGLAREYRAQGASLAQLRGCVRHMVVFAGYGPCLAATLALRKAGLLPEHTPAKVAGPPGDAFELVYGAVTDRVRANMHAADPALGEWIRLHLYGDVYSSPGLDLRRKQLLTCAFLAEAAMPDQLFGHALAALRFGAGAAALREAARLACGAGRRRAADADAVLRGALQTIGMAEAKWRKDLAGQPPACPEVSIPDPQRSVCVPPLPPPVNPPAPSRQQQQQKAAGAEPEAAGGRSDARVDVSVAAAKAAGGGGGGAGWGTSNLGRPSSLAVDVIAARMEQQRARSGLFFAPDTEAAQLPEPVAPVQDAGGQEPCG